MLVHHVVPNGIHRLLYFLHLSSHGGFSLFRRVDTLIDPVNRREDFPEQSLFIGPTGMVAFSLGQTGGRPGLETQRRRSRRFAIRMEGGLGARFPLCQWARRRKAQCAGPWAS